MYKHHEYIILMKLIKKVEKHEKKNPHCIQNK